MASMSSPSSQYYSFRYKTNTNTNTKHPASPSRTRILLCQDHNQDDKKQSTSQVGRRDIILRSTELAVIGAIFNLSGKKPDYLGVQKNQKALALCPATKTCISTSENISDLTHYAPPWNYNGGRKKPVGRELAMEELLQVIKSTKPDNYTPKIVEQTDDYLHVEYQSPILGIVDDVEFWFPPGNNSTVEYRSASRLGNFDFDANRKRIKTLRLELEEKGWASEDSF